MKKNFWNRKIALALALLFAVSMIAPALADIYIPPGPPNSMAAYITPTLSVINSATKAPIGWMYTDGPTYNFATKDLDPAVSKEDPTVPSANALSIPWGTKVTIVGFFPGVSVSADQVPPAVELKMMWNGIPNLVTLTLPTSQVVGNQYPPVFYPDINTPYQFGYPAAPPSKNASYNIWVGDYAYAAAKIFGITVPPVWFETQYGQKNGLWFWYTFTPNTGDWIAYDSTGQTKFPPTYDVIALLEYGTSQVWTNHVAWDVSFLQLHKDVSYCTNQIINDMITITNTAILPATGLSLTQTFPWGETSSLGSDDSSSTFPNLPSSLVNVTVTSGADVYPLAIVLSNVPPGFDVSNQAYVGFCVALLNGILPNKTYQATLISSLTQTMPWDKINYILNHQGGATAQDVEAAIWLVEGFNITQIQDHAGFTPSASALALYNDSNANGNGFVPGPGQIVAVWCQVNGGQDLLIELTEPPGRIFEPSKTYINPEYAKACIAVKGPTRSVGPTLLANFSGVANPSVYTLPAPFNVINPGETVIITMPLDLYNLDNENITIVFDSMVFANEIPPWMSPIGLASIPVGNPTGGLTPLWNGYVLGASTLFSEPAGHMDYGTLPMWYVQTPIIRMQLQHPAPVMALDPEPVPLIAGETTVTAADVALVRNAVVGLAPFDMRMDCNGNGKVDVSDLMQYKTAAGM